MGDTAGKEVIVTFQGKIENNNIFYTDSNGLEMQKRQIDFRPSWNYTKTT